MSYKFELNQKAKNMCFLISVLPIFGLFFMFISYNVDHDLAILKTNGISCMAKITGLQTEISKKKQVSYNVTYLFLEENNDKSEYATRVTTEMKYKELTIGEMVPIVYDPSKPSRSNLNFNDRIHLYDPYGDMHFIIKTIFPILFGTYFLLLAIILSSSLKKDSSNKTQP